MSAGEAVVAALGTAVAARLPEVETRGNGALPRAEVALMGASDWGTKTEAGRELRTAVTIRVAEGQAARLPALIDAAEAAGMSLAGALSPGSEAGAGGWRVASAVLLRTRLVVERGQRVAVVEHRVRVLAA